jgi:UDPglucose 6-dehydrogenase
MNITVVGTGYVGLVTGTCFAETGNVVTCVDIDQNKVDKLKNGKITIFEPGLEIFFNRNLKENRLKFTTSLSEGIKDAEVIFLALPTPPGADGSADLKYVLGVAEDLGKIIDKYVVIVDKSTVPVGTAEKVRAKVAENSKVDFDIVANPEFLREGMAVEDFMKPDRVVIGTTSDKAIKIMETLYKPFVRQGNPLLFMTERSAELTKYAANAFLATKITFMNEIANLCERVGANVDDIRIGLGSDPRIGNKFLYAGIGYGGSCFPKDVQALEHTSTEFNYDFKILKAVMEVNDFQKTKLIPQIDKYFNGDLKGKTIAMWGLAFKPNTDDIREAPSLYNINELLEKGVIIKVYDPEAKENIKAIYGDKLIYANTPTEALENSDALLIMTEWQAFRNPDFEEIKNKLSHTVIFDGRNLYDPVQMKNLGFDYYSIGRTAF